MGLLPRDYFVHLITDVNECALETHNCQQVCSNTDGSFTCLCFEGYDLDDDQISCTGMHTSHQ